MRNLILALLFLMTVSVFAQKTEVVFFDENWVICDVEYAHFKRVYTPTKDGWDRMTYYPDGTLKESVNVKSRNPEVLVGTQSKYFQNGQLELKGYLVEGKYLGACEVYHENGQKHQDILYLEDKKQFNQIWDESGEALLNNGEGEIISRLDNGNQRVEKYSDFELASSFDVRSTEGDTLYLVMDSPPEFNGGMEAFYQRIAFGMEYPSAARRMGIQGRVYVQFIINQLGKIEEVEVVKGIGNGCDEETVRVVKILSSWTPGEHRGVPVKCLMVLPVYFKLLD